MTERGQVFSISHFWQCFVSFKWLCGYVKVEVADGVNWLIKLISSQLCLVGRKRKFPKHRTKLILVLSFCRSYCCSFGVSIFQIWTKMNNFWTEPETKSRLKLGCTQSMVQIRTGLKLSWKQTKTRPDWLGLNWTRKKRQKILF